MGNGLEALATMWYHMAVNESKGRNIEAGVLQATPNFREVLYWEARPSPLEAKLLVPKSESAARIEASSIDIIQKHCDMPNFCEYCQLSIAIISGVKEELSWST